MNQIISHSLFFFFAEKKKYWGHTFFMMSYTLTMLDDLTNLSTIVSPHDTNPSAKTRRMRCLTAKYTLSIFTSPNIPLCIMYLFVENSNTYRHFMM